MSTLSPCDRCHGFVPHTVDCCPCCEAPVNPVARFARLLLAMLGGSAVAVTLMACYGAPAMRTPPQPPQPAEDAGPGDAAADGDGGVVEQATEPAPGADPTPPTP